MSFELTAYPSPGKRKGLKICTAFAAGCGGRLAAVGETRLFDGAALFYGWTEHTMPLLSRCEQEGRVWFYADNAYYLGRALYYRVTKRALMHHGEGEADPARFRAFGVMPKPWRPIDSQGHVLIATQSELFYRVRCGVSRAAWTAAVVAELKRHTAREIRVLDKPAALEKGKAHAGEFEFELKGAWALVTHSSSTAVKALLDGVPVFSTAPSMASCVGLRDLARIERPHYPADRERWLAVLCANQWTMKEMREGVAWRDLNRGSGIGNRESDGDRACVSPA